MNNLFEIKDKTGRKIRLTKKQWSHVLKKHPQVSNYEEEIMNTLVSPLKIVNSEVNENIKYYYKYIKHVILKEKYLLVIVKYLNGEGFIVSTFFERYIK